MDLLQLKYFVKIAECGNMTVAAEELYLTQPALSRSLKELEKECACQLFDRERSRLCLNEYGEILLEKAKLVLDEIENAQEQIDKLKSKNNFLIKIISFNSAIDSFIMPKIKHDLTDYKFEYNCISGKPLLSYLKKGLCDIIIDCNKIEDDEIGSVHLYHEDMLVLLPQNHPLASHKYIAPKELKAEKVYINGDSKGFFEWGIEFFNANDMELCKIPIGDILEMMSDNKSIHITSSFYVDIIHISKQKTILPLIGDNAQRDVYMYYQKSNINKLSDFIKYVDKNKTGFLHNMSYLLKTIY